MYRSVVVGMRGMVASAHPLASWAGARVLAAGGNAFDAMIATNAMLNVTQPHMCGIGGDLFCLIYRPDDKRVRFLNAAGYSSHLASREYFARRGLSDIPHRGALPVIVPGCVSGWALLHDRYGSMPFPDILAAAIEYAETGFPVSHTLSQFIEQSSAVLRKFPTSAAVYLPGGAVPRPGQILRQPGLATTLRQIAHEGPQTFYRGDLMKRLVAFIQQNGGMLTEEDFRWYAASLGDPLQTTYRGHTIYETPPPTRGLAALVMLNILEGYDLSSVSVPSGDRIHLMVEAAKLAFCDLDRYVTDPAHMSVDPCVLLSKEYAAHLRTAIDLTACLDPGTRLHSDPGGDTTYFAVADVAGNLVSAIQSIYFAFGSGLVASDSGVVLQNRGAYFSLVPTHVNRLEPWKQPSHTLTSSVVIRDGSPILLFGTMGADGQPQTHVQGFVNMLDLDMNIQDAIEAPRFLLGRFFVGDPDDTLNLECRFGSGVLRDLEGRGHRIRDVGPWHYSLGHAQGIAIDPTSGAYFGGADPRGDGAAVGF